MDNRNKMGEKKWEQDEETPQQEEQEVSSSLYDIDEEPTLSTVPKDLSKNIASHLTPQEIVNASKTSKRNYDEFFKAPRLTAELLTCVQKNEYEKANKIATENPGAMFEEISIFRGYNERQKITPLDYALEMLDVRMLQVFWDALNQNEALKEKFKNKIEGFIQKMSEGFDIKELRIYRNLVNVVDKIYNGFVSRYADWLDSSNDAERQKLNAALEKAYQDLPESIRKYVPPYQSNAQDPLNAFQDRSRYESVQDHMLYILRVKLKDPTLLLENLKEWQKGLDNKSGIKLKKD